MTLLSAIILMLTSLSYSFFSTPPVAYLTISSIGSGTNGPDEARLHAYLIHVRTTPHLFPATILLGHGVLFLDIASKNYWTARKQLHKLRKTNARQGGFGELLVEEWFERCLTMHVAEGIDAIIRYPPMNMDAHSQPWIFPRTSYGTIFGGEDSDRHRNSPPLTRKPRPSLRSWRSLYVNYSSPMLVFPRALPRLTPLATLCKQPGKDPWP
ncbi:hypothetical protein QBC36DRAFT_374268 [Triangularia setosa]|uniref:Uncharacterized protein n=1 Tax=Triangularia setosa TaxID=2587417 RepID=A0AAN7ABR9_9PEZI|nr:hypothetical protein QBC36DRAFT_374268 [Podospora setosa]